MANAWGDCSQDGRVDPFLLGLLICPKHSERLADHGGSLVCPAGCEYPVIAGIPILLLTNVEQTFWVADASLQKARQLRSQSGRLGDPCLETLGLNLEDRMSLETALRSKPAGMDPVISHLVAATNGLLYKDLIGRLPSYPVPDFPLRDKSDKKGTLFLDIGCGWGRWCVAAARQGYSAIGIDPSLGAVLAAQRMCRDLQINARFVVGDARYLPFANDVFDIVFSYSVLQHLSKVNVRTTLREINRVVKSKGISVVQMPNAFGIRSIYHQIRQGFHHARDFEVRYWRPAELKKTFEQFIGPTCLLVDCFFGLGIHEANKAMLSRRRRIIVGASSIAKSINHRFRFRRTFADSLYAYSVNE